LLLQNVKKSNVHRQVLIPIYEFMMISAAGLVLTSGQGRPHNVHLVRFEQR